jgi:cyclopropane fatty-acyl-phospholipid synthase-like methyltransferase
MRDWEKCYQDGSVPWDKGGGAPPLLEWLSKNADVMSGEVLVPGCGLGHDVRALENGVEGTTLGLDLSPTAVKQASALPSVGGESYHAGDLFALPEDWLGRFDWVWEHTCFCAIEPERRDDYVAAVRAVLKSGGSLLGVFYLNPYDEEHGLGEGPPHETTEEELRARFAEGFEWVESYVPTKAYPSREGKELVVRLRKL